MSEATSTKGWTEESYGDFCRKKRKDLDEGKHAKGKRTAGERQAWYEVDVIGFPYWTFGLPALDRKAGGGSVRTQDQRGALCLHGARQNVF